MIEFAQSLVLRGADSVGTAPGFRPVEAVLVAVRAQARGEKWQILELRWWVAERVKSPKDQARCVGRAELGCSVEMAILVQDA